MGTRTSNIRPADSSGNSIELYVRMRAAMTADSTCTLYEDGIGITVLPIPGGDVVAEQDMEAGKVFRNINEYQVVFDWVGAEDFPGANVQLRAI